MATYVLLPGATTGGWFMKKVAMRVRNAGNEVFTPTYTGTGERSHLLSPEIDLETHILDALQVLKYEDLNDVILVGKSYSGMVITGVADRAPERIRHLVYLDAVVPQDGQSLLDLMDPESATAIKEIVKTHGEGWFIPANSSDDPRLTDHPWKTFTEPIRLSGNPVAERIPRTYIYCTVKAADDPGTSMLRRCADMAKAKGWNYHEIPTGHKPEQDTPDEVTAILLELA